MKKFRIVRRSQAITLLFVFLFDVFSPTVSLAIGDEPDQPDFQSYEDFGSTDMVNLLTGDFTYNIPLVGIPSPDGDFQIPLTYNAGIGVDQESSWVGLGWALNPGVLNRYVSVVPDDFNGNSVQTTVQNSGNNASIKNYPFYRKYYSSKRGSGGVGSLMGLIEVGWGSESGTVNAIAFRFKDGTATFDAQYLGQSAITMGMLIASFTPAAPAVGAAGTAYAGFTISKGLKSNGSSKSISQIGAWTVEEETNKGVMGLWGAEAKVKYYIDQNVVQKKYGSLYLGDVNSIYSNVGLFNSHLYVFNNPTNPNDLTTNGIAPNTSRVTDPAAGINVADFAKFNSNTSLGYDNFLVKGPGVGGSISPYRLESGTLYDNYSSRLGAQFLGSNVYKVPFRYKGEVSNSYLFHNANSNNLNDAGNFFNLQSFGSNFFLWNNTSRSYANYNASNGAPAYSMNFSATNLTETNRLGLFNRKLVHKKHIEWYSNDEIVNGSAGRNGFINTHQDDFVRTASGIPQKGIGGFSITNEDGITFHYTIPVYNKSEFDYSIEPTDNTNTYFKQANENYYATMWLLTGITGPDFVDRGTLGEIDNQDWGYWIQFDYGKFSENFSWRNPYFSNHENGFAKSIRRGQKQTYYLNRISTRTHTALFPKSLKSDGKSFFDSDGMDLLSTNNQTAFAIPTDSLPSSSLKLDDIYLMENSVYEKLVAPINQGGFGLAYGNSSNFQNELLNGDTYANVLDNHDMNNIAMLTYLYSNMMQRIHFNYNYLLCPATYNSFDNSSIGNINYDSENNHQNFSLLKGKLTLRSVEYHGKNNAKLMPNYDFFYGNENSPTYNTNSGDNPNYHPHKYDGYGLFKSGGVGNENSPHNSEPKGDQWSLSNIVSPLGSTISVKYERDSYSSVNGNDCVLSSWSVPCNLQASNVLDVNANFIGTYASLADYFELGDPIKIKYSVGINNFTQVTTLSAINSNLITFSNPIPLNAILKEVQIKSRTKKAGDIRTKEITYTDENNNQYATKYIYTKNGLENGITSGVASSEQTFDHGSDGNFSFYNRTEHPNGPVMYANVSVINGKYDNVFKENSRQKFHFITPHKDMITESVSLVYNQGGATYAKINVIDNTSKIGSIDTIKQYNQFSNLQSRTVFDYSNNANKEYGNLGLYDEASFLMQGKSTSPQSVAINITQSYKFKTPNILKKITTYKDKVYSTQEMVEYDFQTGQQSKVKTTLGGQEKYQSEVVFAYSIYGPMGSKVYSPSYKNMMSEITGSYDYVFHNNNKSLLSASVLTYDNSQNTRAYYQPGGAYATFAFPYAWQPTKSYIYKSKIEENGTINQSEFVPFSYSPFAGNDPRWVKTSEAKLYDYYSRALEIEDIYGRPTSVKYGYKENYLVAFCDNTKYENWCVSGAEDASPIPNYYEGEVAGSFNQYFSNTFSHTGSYCSKMLAGQAGFAFRLNKSNLPLTGKYRGSVWIHENGVQNALFECIGYTSNGAPVFPFGQSYFGLGYNNMNSGNTIEKAGNFYILNIEVDLAQVQSQGFSNVSYLEFKVSNNASQGSSAIVYADDFRVHPLSSPIQSKIFDLKSGQMIAVLDKENYATKMLYDDAGKLKATFKETKNGFIKVGEYKYNYAK